MQFEKIVDAEDQNILTKIKDAFKMKGFAVSKQPCLIIYQTI